MLKNYDRNIFVFGANEAGRHGAGAARFAREHFGAIYGQGYGLQGDSFGIPTKTGNLEVLSLDKIQVYIKNFLDFAREHPSFLFHVTPVGTGLAGYEKTQIGILFRRAGIPENVVFTREWFTG